MSLPKSTLKDGTTVIPLSDISHLHTYEDGYHMADNLPGGAKIYYDISSTGDVGGIRLLPRKGMKSIPLK